MLYSTYTSSSSLRSLASRIINFAGPSRPLERSASSAVWPSKSHMKKKMGIPPPLPAIYPQRVVLSDGSTFTAYTTAPTPSIIRLTRDVTNNPLWAPGSDKKGLGSEAEDGRVGRFKRRFEGMTAAQGEAQPVALEATKAAKAPAQFAEGDFDWMSEGAVEEKVSAKQMGGAKPSKKK